MESQNEIQNLSENKNAKFVKILPLLAVLVLVAATVGIFVKKPALAPKNTGTATLSWNANTEADLSGYRIYYGTAPRTDQCPSAGYPQKADVGKTQTPEKPSHNLENLENGKTYYFSITSYDASGNESCFSDEMSKAIAK